MDAPALFLSIVSKELKKELLPRDLTCHFAELGVSSLSALRVSNQLEAALKRKIPITFLWQFKTLEEVMDYLSSQENIEKLTPISVAPKSTDSGNLNQLSQDDQDRILKELGN